MKQNWLIATASKIATGILLELVVICLFEQHGTSKCSEWFQNDLLIVLVREMILVPELNITW